MALAGTAIADSSDASPRRTQAERRNEAREAIVQAATACFNDKGFHATTMADIAERAGVSKGLLHYHFNNKETLAIAVEDRIAGKIFDRIMATARPLEPSVKQALWALDELWSNLMSAQQFVPITIDLAARAIGEPEKKQRFAEMLDAHSELLKLGARNILGPAAESSEVSEQVLADTLLVMLAGIAIGQVFIDDETRYRNMFDEFKKMLVRHVLPGLEEEASNGST